MSELANISTIRAIMERHGFRFSKAMGQNFIINPGICPKIAEQGGAGPRVGALEVGPGIGVLTKELALRCQKVVAVELDTRLLPVLAETLEDFDNVTVINDDIMTIDLHELLAREFADVDEVIVCANLPYYITSPVIMRLLEERLPLKSLTVMVQKEAAQRLCAPMPSRQAGAITAAVAYYTRPSLLFSVAPGSFMPAPKVESAVIRLEVRAEPAVAVADEALLFQIIKAAFSQRRKTLLNCLVSFFSLEKAAVAGLLEQAGIPANARGEALALEDFARLTEAWAK